METKLLSITEAADILGLKVSTLHEWTSKKKIEHVRVGGLIKFEQEAIERFIEANRIAVKSTDDRN